MRRHLVAALAALLLCLAAPSTALAVDYVVNTTADGADSECALDCTLREAITLAGPSDTVIVPAGTYQLQTAGELVMAGDKINGAGARATIIRGNGTSRVISAESGPGNESSAISGVTITNGGGAGIASSGSGGGIYSAGAIAITNSHIVANTANLGGGGLYVASGQFLVLSGSTVAGNTVSNSGFASGGGIEGQNENILFAIINSTITGNTVTSAIPSQAEGGGIAAGGGTNVLLSNSTVAGNTAGVGGGISIEDGTEPTFANSIIADNVGGACSGGVAGIVPTSHNNLVTDGSCALTGPGNLQGVGAQLGALANNGGPTDTRALAPTSPAVNAGGSDCQATDQRGVARPQGGACDIGAYEYRAPVLTVTTTVVNDHGFNDVAADFTVRAGGIAAPGSAGTPYSLAPGTYTVVADPRRQYTFTYGGACASNGSVSLAEGTVANCVVTANDPSPTPGREVNALPARGTVKVKLPGRNRFRQLKEGEQLPEGTTVDTLKGRVTLIAAGGQKATFYSGIFKIAQGRGSKPLTTLTLTEKLSCKKASSARATAAAKKKKKRRLWGDGSGRFRTKGKHSAATVVGTKWLVEDRCTSTLTKVIRGKVEVRDFAKKKTVTVKKGKRYVAKAK